VPERNEATGERVPWRDRNRVIGGVLTKGGAEASHDDHTHAQFTHHATAAKTSTRSSRGTSHRIVTRDFLLAASMCSSPSEVMELFLSNRRIADINQHDINEFQNIYLMELGDNYQVPVWKLRDLPQLRELHVPCNALEYISFQDPSDLAREARRGEHWDTDQQRDASSQRNNSHAHANGDYDSRHQYTDEEHELHALHRHSERIADGRQTEEPFAVPREDTEIEVAHEGNTAGGPSPHHPTTTTRLSQSSNPEIATSHHHHIVLPSTQPREMIFSSLETLNLSHNYLHVDVYGLFYQLALLPSLRRLNLASNEFTMLPEDLSDLRHLVFLSVEGNHLREEAFFSLSTIPNLEKLNASRNKIRRIPRFGSGADFRSQKEEYEAMEHSSTESPIVFPQLKMLSIGENLITYHEDLYNLLQFHVLEQIFIWNNPVCDSRRELELSTQQLSTKDIQIILNGPIPPPTKELSVKNFYNHKLKTIKSYEHVTRKKQKRATPKPPNVLESGGGGSSFFITETNTVHSESEQIPDSEYDTATSVHAPHMQQHESMPLTPASTQYRGTTTQSSMRTTTEDTARTSKSKLSSNAPTYDYNADWFKLDSVLQKMSVDQSDPFFMDDHSMSMRVGNPTSKATKIALKDLKFALDHPLKTVDDRYVRTRFAMNTKNLRLERKKARDDNVDRFYQSARSSESNGL